MVDEPAFFPKIYKVSCLIYINIHLALYWNCAATEQDKLEISHINTITIAGPPKVVLYGGKTAGLLELAHFTHSDFIFCLYEAGWLAKTNHWLTTIDSMYFLTDLTLALSQVTFMVSYNPQNRSQIYFMIESCEEKLIYNGYICVNRAITLTCLCEPAQVIEFLWEISNLPKQYPGFTK